MEQLHRTIGMMGASSIDVDATEHSLLSTSFITGLLRDADPAGATRTGHRASLASDFSEMTYPPPRSHPMARAPPAQRPTGGRPPPSAFNHPIPESAALASDDETLYSNLDDGRSGERSRRVNADGDSSLRHMKVTSSTPSYGIKDGMDLETEYTPHTLFRSALPCRQQQGHGKGSYPRLLRVLKRACRACQCTRIGVGVASSLRSSLPLADQFARRLCGGKNLYHQYPKFAHSTLTRSGVQADGGINTALTTTSPVRRSPNCTR
ncbi:hypothetical protein C8F01DRAFT_200272 [Mycena amicta]|nr:hypothetical protein C8F01DRAFT_200272 [Mycena amicta]